MHRLFTFEPVQEISIHKLTKDNQSRVSVNSFAGKKHSSMDNISQLYTIYQQYPRVITDTRKELKDSIFFCLKGPNFDANTFAEEALLKGAAHVVSDDVNNSGNEKITIVHNVLETLQALASHHRKSFSFPVIGLTGSNGKTTNKELIAAVLSERYRTYFTEGNLNNHIGVPLTLLAIPLDCEMAVIEMGANHKGEIRDLCAICRPDFGMITNIGKAHLEGFGSAEGVIKGKKELFDHISENGGRVFVNGDDKLLYELSENLNRTVFGKSGEGYYVEGSIIQSKPFISFRFENQNETSKEIKTNLVGGYNFYNLLAAACIGTYFDVSMAKIEQALEKYVPTNNRSQWLKTKSNEIILDAYNANPSSMDAAIENLHEQKSPSKVALLGEMRELGSTATEEHQLLINKIHSFGIKAMLVGEGYKHCDKKDFLWFENSNDLIDHLKNNPITNSLILLKGSRAVAMEKVVDYL